MAKVVFNACHGGFGLSAEAVARGRQISGNPQWGGDIYTGDMPRHDQTLIRVVEELGPRANGRFADLRIAEIEGGRYWIDEYDGSESVETPESIAWVTIT